MTFSAFLLLVGDWFRVLQNRGGSGAVFVLGLAVAVFLVTLTPIRRRILRITRRDPAIAAPPKLDRAAAAAGVVVLNVAPPVVGMLAIYLALDLFDLSPARIDQTLIALIAAVGAATALYSLGLAILAPGKPQWRLVSLGDPAAARLLGLVLAAAITFALGLFAARLMDVLFAPISLVIALAGLFAVIDSLIVMLALRTTARAFADQEETVGEEAAATPADGAGRSVIWRWVIPIAWIAASVAIGAAVIGEVSLARFIGNQILWAGSIVSTLYILLILTDEAIIATFKPMTAVGQSLIRSMGFARETVEQIGVVLAGLARMLLMTVAVLMVLTPWGVSSTDVVGSARAAFFGVQIGGFTFSLSNVLTAFVIFAIGVVLTRGVQGWLDHRFLPRTRLDVGLQNSIRTSFGYVGFVVAAMLAFSFVGIDLQSFAIVAGALSLGIGFGLQSIVSNFVSGLILLAERPIKAGDMIKIGDEQGTVRKINVRSTEIETFDRASLIVPNSSLITGSVKNWMHRDVTGRSVVNIGVVYGSDPLTVQDLLVGAARAHRLVLKFPEPKAFLVNFSETAMEFRLVCTVGNVNDAFAVESDLRVAVLKRLLDAGIEIPYGRRELHIDQLDGLKELIERVLAAPAGVKPAPETPPELG